MRLGLIGLGRIGAFHATTLISLDAVESLVVYDQVSALVEIGGRGASVPNRLRASMTYWLRASTAW